jgi:hypothetical protein
LTTRQPLRLAMKLALSPSRARAASIIAMMSFVLCTVFDDIKCNLSFQEVEDEAGCLEPVALASSGMNCVQSNRALVNLAY